MIGEELGIGVGLGLPPAQVPEAQAASDGGAAQVAAGQVQADTHPCPMGSTYVETKRTECVFEKPPLN